MSHPMFKNGLFPFIQITTAHFWLFENKILSKILLFFKQGLENEIVNSANNVSGPRMRIVNDCN